MRRNMNYFLTVLIIITIVYNGYGQELDSIRLALNDEMERNINGLHSEDFEDPFYISYSLNDYKIFVVNASLGGMLSSDQNHVRSSNTRVLVGGYEFNDESLQENSVEPYYNSNDMEVPIEDDYKGIRRSLWLSTDKVYKTAGEIFNRHKAELKEKEKKIEDVPHLKFFKAKPVVITSVNNQENIDYQKLEQRIVRLSELFLKYPALSASSVTLTTQNETAYFVNSEGTDVKISDQVASIYIRAALQDESGTYVFDQKRYSSNSIESLFQENNFDQIIDDLCRRLDLKQKANKLMESYEGPVLFLNESVADAFALILDEFSPNLPLSDDKDYHDDYERTNSLENKIGKKVMSDNLNIRLRPTLVSYENSILLGSFQIDAEGIVPDDEIVLVENGVVKNLMTSRNYKQPEFIPNGTGQNPGVVDIDIKSKLKTMESLKKRMMEIVGEEGLEYGIIVKESNNFGMLDVYKLHADGNEELFTNAAIEDFNIKSLRKILGGTKSRNVFNRAHVGGFTSYIVPEALLIEEVEIEPVSMSPYKLDLPLVDNPVKAITEEN